MPVGAAALPLALATTHDRPTEFTDARARQNNCDYLPKRLAAARPSVAGGRTPSWAGPGSVHAPGRAHRLERPGPAAPGAPAAAPGGGPRWSGRARARRHGRRAGRPGSG